MDKLQVLSGLSSARRIEKVDLSEYGIDGVYIKKLSVADRSRIAELSKDGQPQEAFCGFILTTAIVDADGRKIFDDPDADGKIIVSEFPADLVDDLIQKIWRFSGLTGGDEAQSEKN